MPALPLDPPLRRAVPSDAMTLAVLANDAGAGIPLRLWKAAVPGGSEAEAWAVGAERLAAEAERGGVVVLDEGMGPVAAMMGMPMREPVALPDHVPTFLAEIVALQNRALDAWYIKNLAAMPGARGQGHGRRLIAAAEILARGQGLAGLSLIVNDANVEAARLYARLGFEEAGRAPQLPGLGWSPWGREWILMARPLGPAS